MSFSVFQQPFEAAFCCSTMVTPEAFDEFKTICKAKGIKITDQEALEWAEKLLGLMSAIYRPIPKDSPFLKGGVYAPNTKQQSRKSKS